MTKETNGMTVKNSAPWRDWVYLGAACLLVIVIFVSSARPGVLEFTTTHPQDSYYNLLVQGFRAGQLNVLRDPAPGLAQLPNPYDPAANTPYVWEDNHLAYEMSYYHGKLYLYFGVTPVLVLFWPYEILTGHYLSHRDAVVIFCSAGFLAGGGLIYALWRRYFPETNIGVVIAGVLAFGLGTGVLVTLSSCDVYEVAKSCAFALTMFSLGALWRARTAPQGQGIWLALASMAYGLAVGARPSILFGAVILLIPVIRAWRAGSRWQAGGLLAAAVLPITLIGLGLMLYNDLRFGSPFEFGWHYQLTSFQNNDARQFSLSYLWYNFRFYFWQPAGWNGHFPFLKMVLLPPAPKGYYAVSVPFGGILLNNPILWFALASPLAWKSGTEVLRGFAGALFLLFAACALTLCLFFSAGSGYETDFLPALMLLAVMGIFGLEKALWGAPFWRTLARLCWGLLLFHSILFNVLVSMEARAQADYIIGNSLLNQKRSDAAIGYFQKAMSLQPGDATFHFALANAFSRAGRVNESILEYKRALEINPDYAEANNNLGYTFIQLGRADAAIPYFQRAVKDQPTYQACYNLAYAYQLDGMAVEAVACYQKALELQPQFIPAQTRLAWILATWPDPSIRDATRALAIAGNANRVSGGADPQVLRTLAAADAGAGQFPEAVAIANQALALARAQSKTVLMEKLRTEIGSYENNSPWRTTNN